MASAMTEGLTGPVPMLPLPFLLACTDNPSVSLTADSSLYTREP